MAQANRNPIELYEAAIGYMLPVVAAVQDSQLNDSTPCVEWNVQQLILHNIRVAHPRGLRLDFRSKCGQEPGIGHAHGLAFVAHAANAQHHAAVEQNIFVPTLESVDERQYPTWGSRDPAPHKTEIARHVELPLVDHDPGGPRSQRLDELELDKERLGASCFTSEGE